jgi:signal transduction histidine kinase
MQNQNNRVMEEHLSLQNNQELLTQKPIKLLIVEDEIIVARQLSNSLKKLGYEVVAIATCGEEGIKQAALNQPDLVLMDIVMPGDIDGIDAAQEIRQRFSIPVVFLTAYADKETVSRAAMTDPFGYILKPFQPKDLYATIEVCLRKHQVEKELQEAQQKAEAEKQQKSELMSIAAHEFKTPLHAIKNLAQLLEFYSEKLTEAKKQRHAQQIQNSVDEMLTLLDDILTLSRVEKGTLGFEPSLVHLEGFCINLIDNIQFMAGDRYQLVLRYQSDSERPVCVDSYLLRHILSNLLTNAIKYSPTGGKIYIDVNCQPRKLILKITDPGIGIPGSDLDRLFQSFHRSSNVGDIPGTGLGLSIVKQCVELHHGAISVESHLNQGTKVIVTLPLQPLDSCQITSATS